MNIAVVGIGYVGLAMAVLLSQRHHVTAVDIDAARVERLSRRQAPIQDADIEAYLSGCELDLTATLDAAEAYRQADWVVISTPTNYDPHRNYFDTSSVEGVMEAVLAVNPRAYIAVKSTVPVGFTQRMLEKHPGGKIVHDPRLVWNTQEVVTAAGGKPVLSKAGHAFMKETMRAVDAVYGGEMSAHHFFRDFAYCDSGMLPWLMVARIISRSGKSLRELVATRMAAYPCSGEINRSVRDAAAVMEAVYRDYAPQALEESRLDGLSLSFKDWRFNLRPSNTEPLLRLNVEARGDAALMTRMTKALLHHIDVVNHA